MTDMTNMTEPANTGKLKRRLRAAAVVVDAARQALSQGGMVDLSGLETEVEDICHHIANVPPEEGHELKTALIVLADDLDRLSVDLSKMHRELAAEIDDTDTRQQAAMAYARNQNKSG